MAFTPNQYLTSPSNVILRDWQHAARLFTDDQFRLAPKAKFSFHVSFGINKSALLDISLVERHRNEINMLVKACDLPSFAVSTEALNQYNRKKNVQITHKYNNINILFHDDNMGVINKLWHNYYNYYYADPSSAKDPGAYNRTATKNFSYTKNSYGLDNRASDPFFTYIRIYQMARHEFVSYTLYNPIIAQWNHNKLDYSQNALHDNQMTIAYEAVSYDVGTVEVGNPEGFALEHYDLGQSPLQGGDGLTSASPSFAKTNVINSSSVLGNAITSVNSYQNKQEAPPSGTSGLLNNISRSSTQGVSGLQGVAFPVADTASTTVIAKTINLG